MQYNSPSLSSTPNRRTSLLSKQRPATSAGSFTTQTRPTASGPFHRHNRLSYNPPPTYKPNDWGFLRQTEEAGPVFVTEGQLYTDPFNDYPPPSDPRAYRSHGRRHSLAESIRNGFSNMRLLGRRMSLSRRPRTRGPRDEDIDPNEIRLGNEKDVQLSKRQSRVQSLMLRRRPSMPIIRFNAAPEALQQRPNRPVYHRATTTSHPPEYPSGGAGARASAAAQNEALQLARATPLPPYRPRSDSFDEYLDCESGIGIVVGDLERTDSREAHIVKKDPADALAPELLEHILSFLDAKTLVNLELVSKKWGELSRSQSVWRQVFYREYAPARSSRVLGAPATAGLGKRTSGQDFRKLYTVRKLIDKRWEHGEAAAIYLNGHKDSVYCIQFDEDKIITGSRDNTIRIWDARTYQCLRKLAQPNNPREKTSIMRSMAEPSGVVPFLQMDASSVEPKSSQLPMWHEASVLCLQYDSEILVTGSSDFTCIVWSIKDDYQPLFKLRGHRAGVLDVCIDSKRIVTCSKDTNIKIWDRNTGSLLNTLTGHRGPVNAVQVRGNLLASASGDGMAKLWRLDTGMCIKEFHSKERGLACVEFSEDGRTIFAGGNDHVIYEYDTTTGKIKRELQAHLDLVRSLHLDSANGRIVSGSYDHSIKVWDSHTGETALDGGLKISLEGWTSSWMLAAKSNYRKIACASQDGRVVIVDFGFGVHGVELVEA